MTTDPATWREAARQLRVQADYFNNADDEKTIDAVAHELLLMARRFENEAKAAEKAKEPEHG